MSGLLEINGKIYFRKLISLLLIVVLILPILNKIAVATDEKSIITCNDSAPWFSKGSYSGHPEYWHSYTYNGHTYTWTYVGGMTGNPSQPDCWAKFQPYLSQSGDYDVYACFYADPQNSQIVPYKVFFNSGSQTIQVNEYAPSYFTWTEVKLGTWNFPAGLEASVLVTDATGEPYDGIKTLNIDTIKFIHKPSVQTQSATSITTSSAIINGLIVDDGGSSILERRFDWGTTQSCSDGWTSNVVVSGNGFSYQLTSLQSGMTYYFRAWAKNSAGWGQGSVLSFTTSQSSQVPTVETQAATGVTTSAATINGLITNDGGSSILERRFDWGTTQSCSDGWTSNVVVSGNGFYYQLIGIQFGITYYFLAKARNSIGWGQGSLITFTTQTSGGENQLPVCSIELQKNGIPINEINVDDIFDIYLSSSSGSIKQVRFLSDENQNGIVDPEFTWTDWYDWDISLGPWHADTKIMRWSFVTPGTKEVWAEEKNTGLTSSSSSNIYAKQVVIIGPLTIASTYSFPHHTGDILDATFTIANRGMIPISLSELVVGGHDLNNYVVDFDKVYDIILNPGDTYNYLGHLTIPNKPGIYHFFCAYKTPDGNWNTNLDVEINREIIKNFEEGKIYREEDVNVFEQTFIGPTPPPAVWKEVSGPWVSWPDSYKRWNEYPTIVVNPSNPQEIYVASIHRSENWWDGQGTELFKSLNGGDSWTPINEGLPKILGSQFYVPIRSIAIAPSNPNILYAGTSRLCPYEIGVCPNGIYKTTNGGSSWTSIGGPHAILNSYYSVSSIEIDPTDSNIVYIGTISAGIWKTSDGGSSWEQIWNEPVNKETYLDVNAIAISPTNPDVVYAAAYNFDPFDAGGMSYLLIPNRLIKSSNGGDSWEYLSIGILTADPKIDSIVVDNQNADLIYVITELFRVYKSANGGNNWVDASGTNGENPLPFPSLLPIPLVATLGSSNSIDMNHIASNILYTSRLWEFSGVFFTPDSGDHWFNVGPKDIYFEKVIFASNSNTLFLYASGRSLVTDRDVFYKIDLSEGLMVVQEFSPCELRVYDSQGRITGLVNGIIKEEIENSTYNEEEKIVTIFSPTDSYNFELMGTDVGQYGLKISSIKEKTINYTAIDIPTFPNATHRYIINWTALFFGEKGVTVQIDNNSDGIIEQNFTTDDTFQIPIANFTYSASSMKANESIQFMDKSQDSDGIIVAWSWNFGDGTTSSIQNPTHMYTKVGTYPVTLKVTDNNGFTHSKTMSIEIVKTPGFELIFVICAIALSILLWKKKTTKK